MNTIQLGSRGNLVVQLQQFLNTKGYFISMDGVFGSGTQSALIAFQKTNNMTADGVARQYLLNIIIQPTKLDLWCLAIKSREGYFAPCAQYPQGTSSWRNNNPGNIEYYGQRNSVKNGRFAKYSTYQDGYNDLKSLLIRACTGQSGIYDSNGSLLQFYAGVAPYKQYPGYSPAYDGNDPVSYATEVASKVGCTIDTIIKTLI